MPNSRRFMPIMIPIDVSFQASPTPTFTFDGMEPGNNITVKSGMATIVLTLVPTSTQSLTFTESPVTWAGNQPPACMSVRRDSDTQVTIVNFNTNMGKEPQPYDFEVSVWCDGIGYMSQDPTILNAEVPPTGGDCESAADDRDGEVKRGPALRAV